MNRTDDKVWRYTQIAGGIVVALFGAVALISHVFCRDCSPF